MADREIALRRQRIRARLKSFGVEVRGDLIDEFVEASLGLCHICEEKNPDGRALSLDHEHATNAIRGFLCDRCNRALGGFRDDEELLLRARDYLIHKRAIAECDARVNALRDGATWDDPDGNVIRVYVDATA